MNKFLENSIFHRRLGYNYPLITHGKGIYLYDENGKKYIDGTGGVLAVNIGHGVREMAERAKELALKHGYLHGSQFSTKGMEDYANELCSVMPKDLNMVFFISGGSEGNESAIKLAKQYLYDSGDKEKNIVISRRPAYHGGTTFILNFSTKIDSKKPFIPWLNNFPSIPAPFCYHCPYKKTYPKCKLECAWALEKAIQKADPNKVAAFITETIIGSTAPAVVPPHGYLSVIREICDKYNVLLIFDEVMTGFGRTGRWLACQHWKVTPDIAVVGKGIGGGLVPLAAVFCKNKIVKTIQKGSGNFNHGFTFQNNPFTTGMGMEVLKYVKKHDLVKNSAVKGKYLLSKLSTLQNLDMVGEVRGLGLMVGLELVEDKKKRMPFPKEKRIAVKVVQAAFRRRLNILFGNGYLKNGQGDAILIGPPFIVTKKEIDKIVEIIRESILEVQNNK
jgi:adenosylmethionine-8-amino-7-oxononanoate aminotransferase|tara:strand:+ start:5754 stop:7091 length:1338 start_codon:yes stop_codon:yes gene_type:complete